MTGYLYELLGRLIEYDTVSAHSNVTAMQYLADHLEGHSFNVRLHRFELSGTPQSNLLAWTGPPRPGGLIISGHLDTVPFEGQPGWKHDALRMEIAEDRVYGRGTSDMKGFLAQCIEAASKLDRATLKRPLVFLFTASEEVGCLGAALVAPAVQEILGDVPRPDLAWIGEPTSFEVLHAHKGIVMFDVTVRGRGGHSGSPHKGVNAIAVMGKVIETVGRYQAERRAVPNPEAAEIFPEAPHDVLNFGTIAGGLAANVIAETCTLRITYRSLPDADALGMYGEIKRRLDTLDTSDWASDNYRAAIELGQPMVVPALLSPRGTALEKALFEATGATSARGALFATDGGYFAKAGIASLVCGPGEYAQAHQPDESILRATLESGTDLILRVIEKMCG